MPEQEIKERGGATRYRTVTLPNGKFLRVAIVKKRGKRGGKTVAGPVYKKKELDWNTSRSDADKILRG